MVSRQQTRELQTPRTWGAWPSGPGAPGRAFWGPGARGWPTRGSDVLGQTGEGAGAVDGRGGVSSKPEGQFGG